MIAIANRTRAEQKSFGKQQHMNSADCRDKLTGITADVNFFIIWVVCGYELPPYFRGSQQKGKYHS